MPKSVQDKACPNSQRSDGDHLLIPYTKGGITYYRCRWCTLDTGAGK